MAQVIVLSDIEAADNTDILQGTRLQTVPAGGFLTFELQADSNDATNYFTCSIQMPNGDKVESIDCIILDSNKNRAYWPEKYSGGNEPPACSSIDGELPNGITTGEPIHDVCAKCPKSKFIDSVDKNGNKIKLRPECNESRRLHVLVDGAGSLPHRINLPATSLKAWRLFQTDLTSKAVTSNGDIIPRLAFIIRLELEEGRSNNFVISIIKPSVIGMIAKTQQEFNEKVLKLDKQQKDQMEIMRGQAIVYDEFEDVSAEPVEAEVIQTETIQPTPAAPIPPEQPAGSDGTAQTNPQQTKIPF